MLRVVFRFMFAYAFYYPLTMAIVWMIGALIYFFRYERNQPLDEVPDLPYYPKVSVIVPCFNESSNSYETIDAVSNMLYPNFDIIAVNDGSSDDTGEILDEIAKSNPKLRVIHLAENQGKAIALRTAALLTDSEFVVGIDGDALPDSQCLHWMMMHFIYSPRVGAVTGNPRIRTRSTLLGKIQVGEFSAIIGLIKRAQRIYGRVFTVSGVISGFRKRALHAVGYWTADTMTEDIDISWKLQLNHWDIRFEPRVLCWILMPETLRGLWKQRLRWAVGGSEALLRNFRNMLHWKSRRMWGVYMEYVASIMWGYTLLILSLLWLVSLFVPLPPGLRGSRWLPEFHGTILGIMCLIQFGVSMYIDYRYDYHMIRNYLALVWYPLVYWVINWLTSVFALPKALGRGRGKRGRWVTTDRGVT